jgi:hypothetical protein
MKKVLMRIFLLVQLIIVPIFISGIFAAPPGPPPNPGGNPSLTGGGVAVGASIDDGLTILLTLGLAYGCYRLYAIWKKKRSIAKIAAKGNAV